jgi:hypothetical protein
MRRRRFQPARPWRPPVWFHRVPDDQPLISGKDPALVAELEPAARPDFRVYHPDRSRGHGDMVDVAPAARLAPVMQDHDPGDRVQGLAGLLLSGRASRPRPDVLRWVLSPDLRGDGVQEPGPPAGGPASVAIASAGRRSSAPLRADDAAQTSSRPPPRRICRPLLGRPVKRKVLEPLTRFVAPERRWSLYRACR